MQSVNIPSMKFFTLDDARGMLPEIKIVVAQMVQVKKALEVLKGIEVHFPEEASQEVNFTKVNKEFHRLSYELYSCFDELEELGCVVKDAGAGLVDFYSVVNGKELFFCWKLGENDILHWHTLDGGFSNRRDLAELQQESLNTDWN